MKISVKSQYALLAILDLALRPGELVKAPVIASRQGIPVKFLEAILLELKQRGFIVSKRGSKGGYTLARLATRITVGQVLAALGERRTLKTCGGIADLLTRLETSVWRVLDGASFAEIAVQSQAVASQLESGIGLPAGSGIGSASTRVSIDNLDSLL